MPGVINLYDSDKVLRRKIQVDDSTKHLKVYDNTGSVIIDIEQISTFPITDPSDISNDLIGSQHLADNAVAYQSQIKDGIIGSVKLDFTPAAFPITNPDNISNDVIGSQHLAGSVISYPDQIKDGIIGSVKLDFTPAAFPITDPADISDDLIGSQHLADNAISYPAQIKDGIIGSAEIADSVDVSYKGFNADMVDGLHASEIGGMVFKLSIDSGTISIPSGYHAQVVVGPINNKYTIDGVLQVDGDFILFEL